MGERTELAAAWDDYRRAEARERKKLLLGTVATLALTAILIYFAVKCLAYAATVPDGKGIDWGQMRATGAARTNQGGER